MADKKETPQDDLQTQILLKEADEALRQERMEHIWKEWGQTIIGIALMVVFGTMLGVGWKSWRASVHAAQTAALIEARENGIIDLAAAKDDLSGDYAGMAALMAAGDIAVASPMQNQAAAALIHDHMMRAEQAGLPRRYDILAEWGALRTRADALPDADRQSVAAAMEDLAGRRGNPYAPVIMIEAASLYGENGNPAQALTVLEKAAGHALTRDNPDLITMIDNLTHLYTLDKNRT